MATLPRRPVEPFSRDGGRSGANTSASEARTGSTGFWQVGLVTPDFSLMGEIPVAVVPLLTALHCVVSDRVLASC